MRDRLIGILSDMEAALDFPEEDAGAADARRFAPAVREALQRMDAHLERSGRGRLMREGLRAVICGRPNVGKSSLLNALLRQERAIVTPIPGTTRDTVEEVVHIQGLAVELVDTAGVAAARDAVEEEALARSRQAVAEADIVLFVVDGSAALGDEDRRLFESFAGKPHLVVINKSDMPSACDKEALRGWTTAPWIDVSALTGHHIPELEDLILKSAFDGPPAWDEGVWVSNVRHIEALRRGREGLSRAADSLEKGLSLDVAALDVRGAADCIGEITGAVCTEEILDAIFSKFCIGK
jgi:tRNA modification GTPase